MLILLGPPVMATQQMEQMSVLAAHAPGDTARPRLTNRPVSRDHSLCPSLLVCPLIQNFA